MATLENKNVYVGNRYVPKIMGEWDNANAYEGLSIVSYQGASYTSKQTVPVGVDILNNDFWVLTGNYNVQVEQYRQDVRNLESNFNNFNNEVITARNGELTLSDRLNKEQQEVNEQLDQTEKVLISSSFDSLDLAVEALNSLAEKTTLLIDTNYTVSQTYNIVKDNTTIRFTNNSVIERTDVLKSVFLFTGKNCTLEKAVIKSPEIWNGENAKWYDNEAVIIAKADYFTAINNTLTNVYRIGIAVRGGKYAKIIDNTIIGNYPAASWTGLETVHFGVTLDGGSYSVIRGNVIEKCVQNIFVGNYDDRSSRNIVIANNILNDTFDHAIYGGNGNTHTVVTGNNVYNSRTSLAVTGDFHVITGNVMYFDGTGVTPLSSVHISLRDSNNCIISDNTIDTLNNVGLSGTSINIQTKDKTFLTNNIIANNTIKQQNKGSAIRVVSTFSTSDTIENNIIKDNIITGSLNNEEGLIILSAPTLRKGLQNKIENNDVIVVDSDVTGFVILINNNIGSFINGNMVKVNFNSSTTKSVRAFRIDNVTNGKFNQNVLVLNESFGTNLNIIMFNSLNSVSNTFYKNVVENNTVLSVLGFSLDNYTENTLDNNRISNDLMRGTIDLNGVASMRIDNKNILNNSYISITPVNQAATNGSFFITKGSGYFNLNFNGVDPVNALFEYKIN